MIHGVHALLTVPQVEEVRAFLRDVLELPFVDAGHGWLIFGLPPAELGVHSGGESRADLYLLCDDVHATVRDLQAKGVEFAGPVREERWGLVTAIRLPGGGELGLYEARHPLATSLKPRTPTAPSGAF
jgi:hypothetical protein